MTRRLLALLTAVVLALAVAAPVGAAGNSEKLRDFYTSALLGDGTFQWVYCSQATRVTFSESVKETYHCELSEWVDGVTPEQGGPLPNIYSAEIVYPNGPMNWDEENSGFSYFSDFLFISCFPTIVLADTWSEHLSPSGQVTMKAGYSDTTSCP